MHEEPINLLGIPPEDWTKTPESVRLAVHALLEIVQSQSTQLKDLQILVKDLQAKAGQTSRNSSKPPSSDPPSAPPKPPKVPRGRKAGGQPGHEGHQRPLVPPERVDEPVELLPEQCPDCHTRFPDDLPTLGEPQRTQRWELPVIRPHITEYRQYTRCCPGCRTLVTADLPPDAPPGAFGPRATTLMAVLRARYRFSLDDAAEFLTDVCNLPISAASVVTGCERTSEALAPVDAAIAAVVQEAETVNADETSWPTQTRKGWLWVAVCAIATSFRVHQSRSGLALRHLLGAAFLGIVGSDRFRAYEQYPDERRQICWAHLLRNLQALLDYYGEETRWAQRVLEVAEEIFVVWRLYKGGWLDQVSLQLALIPVKQTLRAYLEEGAVSCYPKIAGFCREVLAHWEALWTFSRVEGVEPTNNAAERALRHAVLWRKGCFGSRSEAGCRFVERMLSVHATCEQQQRSLFEFVTEAVSNAWAGLPAPVLVQPLKTG
jgi:transposase